VVVQDTVIRKEAVVEMGELNYHLGVRGNLDANPECTTSLGEDVHKGRH
jgi:hypothetical protein